MKKAVFNIISSFIGIALSIGLGFSISSSGKEVIKTSAIGDYSTDASTYYQDITATSGTILAAQLHDLITSTHKYYTSYADNGANGYQKQTDQYYENGSKVSGYIYEFYSGVKWPNAWAPNAGDTTGGYNREHCWCQSNSVNTAGTQMWGENGGGADMHHLRPVETRLNSTRSNNPYGEISNRDSYKVYAKFGTNTTYAHGGYNNGGVFEPLDSKKGDVARIILYTYLHYNSYTVSTLFGSYGTTNGSGSSSYFSTSLLSLTKITNQTSEAKALEMLLSWNTSDPVDEIEQRRNEQVAIYQGNRNPFIDNSNYAEMIWGTGSTTPTVNSISVSPTSLNLDLNGTTTGNLTATVNVSNGAATTVSWSSSNTNVATVSNSGVVTAEAVGTCSITATSTVNSNKSASCTVKVSDSSSGGSTVTSNFSWDLSTNSYDSNPTANLVTWSHNYATMTNEKGTSTVNANNYLGGDSNSRTSSRFYSGNTLTITPTTDYTITSVIFTATSESYATALTNSAWTNASASVSSTTVTVTSTDGANAISAVIGGTCGFTSVLVNYSSNSGSSATLSSISINTSNVQLEFYVGDTFDYSGLIVTAYYDNGTEDIVNPSNVSTPDMSTSGNKVVTVSYAENNVTKTATYAINILDIDISEIYASVNKTYHPGDIITSNDIYVEDDLGNQITSFTFNDDGYQFTYNDATSGGSLTDKTFSNSISYNELTCDLTVEVSRIAFVQLEDQIYSLKSDDGDFSSITITSYKDAATNTIIKDEISYVATNSYRYNSYLSLHSSASDEGGYATDGIIYNSTPFDTSIKTVEYNLTSSNMTPTIRYSNDGSTWSTTNPGNAYYFKISFDDSWSSGYINFTSIVITTYGSCSADNLSNYIMYEDVNGQCNTKFNIAKGYFEALSKNNRAIFMTSNDYVISTARTRLEAWAINLGKTITYSDGDYIVSSSKNVTPFSSGINNENIVIIITIISLISITCIGGYFFLKHKK